MARARRLTAILLCLSAAGCSDASLPGEPPESLGGAEQPIINGALDTAHPAVVAWLHGSKCSATIIARSGSTGYALTAAHCVGGGLGSLYQGQNHNAPVRTYAVSDAEQHPGYGDAPLYDFAMLRFSGADASTPIIPALEPDDDSIIKNTDIELVGFGQTESDPNNSTRRHIELAVDQATDLRLVFDDAIGGLCYGDSGGGAIHQVGGQDRLAGVHSTTSSEDCGGGTSVRVSAVYDTFVIPYINGTAYLPQSCDQCEEAAIYGGPCYSQLEACFDDVACSAYIDCINVCTTQVCVNQCKLDHAEGAASYQLVFDCVCDSECASECSGDSLCDPPPACGLDVSDDECQLCLDASCCGQAMACSAEATCSQCLTGSGPAAGCDLDPTTQSIEQCLAESCATVCDVSSSSGAGGTGAGGASAGAGVGGGPTGGEGAGYVAGDVESDEGLRVESSCAAAPRGRHSATWLAALVLVFLRRRRN